MRFWVKHKRGIILSILACGIFFLIGFFNRYHLPRIKQWMLVEIESASRKNSPIRIWPQSVEFRLLPIGVRLYDVRLLPQKGLETTLAPTTISELDISLSMWALARGQLKIGEAKISGAEFNIIIRPKKETANAASPGLGLPSATGPLSLEAIYQLPIYSIALEKVRFAVKLEEHGLALQSDEVDLTLENRFRSIRGDIKARSLKFKKTGNNPIFETDLDTNFLFDEDGIYFSALRLQHGQTFFDGTGSVRGNLLKNEIKDVRARLRTDENLAEISELAREWFRLSNFPQMSGSFVGETEFEFVPPRKVQATFNLKTQDFKIEKFSIGNIEASGKVDEKRLRVSHAHFSYNYGDVTVDNGDLNFSEAGEFKATVASKELDLNGLLVALGLHEIPVYTKVSGNLPCRGESKKAFRLVCEGSISSPNLRVTAGKEKPFTLVDLDKIDVTGSVTVDTKAVSYQTRLAIGASHGESDGVITYNNGFKINYSTPQLNFSDVKNLVNLKPEGFAAIKGNTAGSTKAATIDLTADGDKFWLRDFSIGRAKFGLHYKAGQLNISGIDGQFNASRFKADVGIDILQSKIQINGSSPYLEAADLKQIFSRKVNLPFTMTGTGSAQLKASGPLEISRMTYDLTSSIFRGAIADETFDQINFNVSAKDGLVDARKVNLTKGRSTVNLTGNVKPTGQMALKVQSHNLQIEQSENLARLKMNLTGNLSFDMSLQGLIAKPLIDMNGRLTQLTVGEQPTPDSDFKFNMTEHEMEGSGQLMGEKLRGDFHIPLAEDGVVRVKSKINGWNFAQAFSIFSDALRASNYLTTMTGDFEFEFPKNNWRLFSGHLLVNELRLKNGRAEMAATKPISLTATKGLIQTHDFEISGTDTYARLRSSAQQPGQIGLLLEGKIDLGLATLFTPFLDELRGQTQFSLTLNGPIDHPIFAGTSFIQDGLIKLKNFPHAFEQLNGDAIFTNDKIVVNSLKGRLGGGLLYASGSLQFLGMGNVPIDIRGTFTDSKLNVPDGFNTRGSGDYSIKGSWLPYTVAVNFDIDSGSIEPKAVASSKNMNEIKPSTFLPKFLSAQRFSPIELLLNINIPKDLPVRMSISPVDIRSKVTGRLKVAGPPDSPKLTGQINVTRGGQVNFRSNIFEIQSGILNWDNSEPANPSLNVSADSKATATLINNETRDYNVHLRVTGDAKTPKIAMTSEPPLAENDLVSLVTLGFVNDQQNTTFAQPQSTGISDNSYQLGGAILNQSLGINRQLEERLGVQFDYSSSYNQVDQATHHKFTLRKQWTPVFGTSASRDVGKTSTSDVKAEYKLNKRVSVIGEWEGQDSSGATTTNTNTNATSNIFGLDLEYKRDFK